MTIYLIPFISAFIGWFSIWMAIKMLFQPREPKRFLGFTIQGIFPKKQKQLAKHLSSLVATELLHFDEIISKLNDPEQLKNLAPTVNKHLDTFLQVKLQEKLPVISTFVGESTLTKIKEAMMEEIELLLPEIITQYTASLHQKIDVEKIVREKITAISTEKLEKELAPAVNKELRLAQLLAGLFGFVTGLIQLLITI